MHRLAVALVIAVSACASNAPPPADDSCDELVAHVAAVRLASSVDRLPEADRDAHLDAATAAIAPTLLATCTRLTRAERACWRDAVTFADLATCAQPGADDVAAVAREPRVTVDEHDLDRPRTLDDLIQELPHAP